MTYQIVISDSKVIDLESGQTAFSDVNATLRTIDARTPAELIANAADADGLIVDAATQVTADFSRHSNRCRSLDGPASGSTTSI